MQRVEGPLAFLRGVHGVGPRKAEKLHATLGDDSFRVLVADPYRVEAAYSERAIALSNDPAVRGYCQLIAAVESILLWRRFLDWITHPVPAVGKVRTSHATPLRQLPETELISVVGRAIRDGLQPGFRWVRDAPAPSVAARNVCLFVFHVPGPSVSLAGVYAGRSLSVRIPVPFDSRWAYESKM